ncbi:MAG: glycosyltransferase family 39 protein [Candidatus Nealsonbacteria bacterium]
MMSDYLLKSKIKELIQKKRFLVLVLVFFLFFQLIYSFLVPSCGLDNNWLHATTYLAKFKVESADNVLLDKFYPLISSEYRLNSDAGHYLELAKNFTPEYFNGHVLLARPLYSFLIFLISLPIRFFTAPSYGIVFGLAIFLNFILLSLTVYLFFKLLEKLFSLKTAFLSSVLLIFSPFAHTALVQPRADILVAFTVTASVYLLFRYIKNPSILKLVIFSLIIGILMLGKMFFAVLFFILLLAVYFKRYRQGIIFLISCLIPMGLWYLWITQVWQIPYYIYDVQYYSGSSWLFHIFQWPWYQTGRVLLAALPNFIQSLIYSFLLVPIIFSVIGFSRLPFKSKNIFYFGSIFSVFLLCFSIDAYFYRHTFLLFPIIYPTAILGIDRIAVFLKRRHPWHFPIFYALAVGFIIFISSINVYRIFGYL